MSPRPGRRCGQLLLATASLILYGCGAEPASDPEREPSARGDGEAERALPRYDARAFHEGVSLSMAAADGFPVTADDLQLLVTTDESGIFNAALIDLDSGAHHRVTDSTTDAVQAVSAFPQDERLLVIDDLETGRSLEQVRLPTGDINQVRFDRSERRLMFLSSSDVARPEVYVAALDGSRLERLTHASNPAIDENQLVHSELVRYPSFDGLGIPAILYRPPEAAADHPVPALVWVHGGGAYLTVAALAFRPDEFRVGIEIFGVTNWVRTLESIPPWWESMRRSLYAELGDPAVDGQRLRRISPLFRAERIERPLLVIQGANDPRVLQVESDEIVETVRANDVPVEYLVVPDEGHGFSGKENRIAASQAILDFVRKHL